MAKEKAVYAPGELNKVRQNLGSIDEKEAKRMANILGGEVGVEKKEGAARNAPTRRARPSGGAKSQPKRRVGIASDEEEKNIVVKHPKETLDPDDDPSIPIDTGFFDRLKMDRYAAQPEFEIKSMFQVIATMFSLSRKSNDFVNPAFINRRLPEYYEKIELLVVSTRSILPRQNVKNNEQLKKMSPFLYSVLDVIRNWNVERISSDMARMQVHPKTVRINDMAEILRAVYKPLFILEQLEYEVHIKGAYKLLYKILYIDNPGDAKEKYQELIRSALVAYETISIEFRYLLYPLLMKLLSNHWLSYHDFFSERSNRIMAFLNISEKDRLSPENFNKPEEKEEGEKKTEDGEKTQAENSETAEATTAKEGEKPEDTAKQVANESEKKALDRGLKVLESLFPQAGWDKLETYPDLYVYFAKVLDLKHGYELIAPSDPVLQAIILTYILENLIVGLRAVTFEFVEGIDEHLDKILNSWRDYEDSFEREYLTRLSEYCQLVDSVADARNSSYAKRLHGELQWIRRLCFFPHYRFETVNVSSMKRDVITSLYSEVRKLRKYLTIVASSIEQGTKQGGAEKQIPCKGIANPWTPYKFQVTNPLSMRLNALLSPSKRNNASLVYFTLSVVTVLDYFMNSEDSWAYSPNEKPIFRSIDGDAEKPQFGIDKKTDADAIFKQVLQNKQKEKDQKSPTSSEA